MVHIFNRAEVLITYDLDRLNQARDILAAAGIEYTYHAKDQASPTLFGSGSRARTGTFGVNHDARVEYKLYVQRADMERAKRLL